MGFVVSAGLLLKVAQSVLVHGTLWTPEIENHLNNLFEPYLLFPSTGHCQISEVFRQVWLIITVYNLY